MLGVTASGKTRLASLLANKLNGEIISADSRQVYKNLNIGTGKDYDSYTVNDNKIPYHLIDICDVETHYYLHNFCNDLALSFIEIQNRKKLPIICGGTGLYLSALHQKFNFTQVKPNLKLRETLTIKSQAELLELFESIRTSDQINTDTASKKRLIRAIEIAYELKNNSIKDTPVNNYNAFYIGIKINVDTRRRLISERLNYRLKNGLIEEVEALLKSGITHERLQFLGLEYKFTSLFLLNKLNINDFHSQLQTAIFQYAKRQQTWFNKMEREKININWLKFDYDDTELNNLIECFKTNKSVF